MSVVLTISSLGEVAERSQLIARGVRPSQLAAAIRSGSVTRVRRGWFATASASLEQLTAVRIGGRIGGTTACATFGIWVPESDAIHVSLYRNSSRLRPSPTRGRPVILDWTSDAAPVDPWTSAWRVDLESAVAQCLRLLAVDEAIALLDSALHARALSRLAVSRLLLGAPEKLRSIETLMDARAESGTESLVRVRLAACGVVCMPQVKIPGVGRVDLVVGDRLVIEVDGFRFHSSAKDFARDRDRDLTLAALGYRVIRLSYRQVISDWPASEAAILAVLDAGEHLAVRRFSG